MYKKIIFFFSILIFSGAVAITPYKIIKEADKFRGASKPFSIITEIFYYKKNKLFQKQVVKVYVKDIENTIVKFLKPLRMKRRILLMRKDNIWIQIPGTRNPIRLTPQQRLLGQASNGDVARMNYSGDYKPYLLKIENINGKEYYVLNLIAKRRSVTYHKIKYFVEKESFRPYQAYFYVKSGKLLKKAIFLDFKKLGDRIRVSKLIIYDMIKKSEYTILKYKNFKFESLPSYYFQKNYLKRIR